MTYHPTLNSRERILLTGPAGTGKSWAAFDVAKHVVEAGHTVFVIDNDFSYLRMMETHPAGLGEDGEFRHTDCYADDWEGHISALEAYVSAAGRDDLLIIDSMTPTWQAVQDHYVEQVFADSLDGFFLAARKQDGKGLDGWRDWGVINKMYGRMYHLLNRFPGHVILTAEVDTLVDPTDKETAALYGPFRAKPRGQKSLGHRVNTILLLSKARNGTFSFTVIKDRGRESYPRDEDYKSFFTSYFIGRANWEAS